MIRPDDWQVTAYALGELSERERVDVETAAAADPAVRSALDEAAAAAGVLTAALRKELVADAGPALDSAQRAAILERAANGAPVLSLTSRLRRWGLFAATAAAVMVGAFVWASQPIVKISDISQVSRRSGEAPFLSPSNYTPPEPPSLWEGGRPTGDEDGCMTSPVGRPAGASGPIASRPRVPTPLHVTPGGGGGGHALPTSLASGPVVPTASVEVLVRPGFGLTSDPRRHGAGGAPITAFVDGVGGRRYDELYFGTPANPQGQPFPPVPPDVVLRWAESVDSAAVPAGSVVPVSPGYAGREAPGTESYDPTSRTPSSAPRPRPSRRSRSTSTRRPTPTCGASSARASCRRADAVRIEELVNYFPYDYAAARRATTRSPCTSRSRRARGTRKHRLVRIGDQGPRDRAQGAAGQQPRLPGRRLRLDGRAEQAAAGQGVDADARRGAGRERPRGDRRLRRARRASCCRPPPASRRPRSCEAIDRPRGRRLDERRGGHPARLRDRRRRLHHRTASTASSSAPTATSTSASRATSELVALIEEKAKTRRLPDRARLRHGQPTRTRRWRSSPTRATATTPTSTSTREARKVLVEQVRGHARHDRQGREDPGRVQPGAGRGLPADRLREPPARGRGLQRRQEGRGRDRRRAHRHRALRDRARRASRSRPPRCAPRSTRCATASRRRRRPRRPRRPEPPADGSTTASSDRQAAVQGRPRATSA